MRAGAYFLKDNNLSSVKAPAYTVSHWPICCSSLQSNSKFCVSKQGTVNRENNLFKCVENTDFIAQSKINYAELCHFTLNVPLLPVQTLSLW